MTYRRLIGIFAFTLVILFGSLSPAMQAQAVNASSALPADAATRAQIMTLLDTLRVRNTMQIMLNGIKESAKNGTIQGLKHDKLDVTARDIERINSLFETAFEDLKLDDYIEPLITVYQHHLSKSDVDEMIRFYAGPVGQKYLNEQPQMLQETMKASQEITRAKLPAILDKVERRVKELEAADAADSSPAKK